MIKHDEIRLSQEDRCLRARYLGALADRVFRAECARLGLDADDAIKSPLSSIIARQGRGSTLCAQLSLLHAVATIIVSVGGVGFWSDVA
jgi:hypothetical protein